MIFLQWISAAGVVWKRRTNSRWYVSPLLLEPRSYHFQINQKLNLFFHIYLLVLLWALEWIGIWWVMPLSIELCQLVGQWQSLVFWTGKSATVELMYQCVAYVLWPCLFQCHSINLAVENMPNLGGQMRWRQIHNLTI